MSKDNITVQLDDEIIDRVQEITNDKNIDIKDKINNILYYALEEENIKAEKISVSISCASKEEIKDINKQYRGIDKATDVLSFPIFEREELRNIANQSDESKKLKELELGDIILCLDVVYEQSIEYGTGMLRETLYMITHGICHLLGFDHIEEKIVMRELEEKILSKVGVTKD